MSTLIKTTTAYICLLIAWSFLYGQDLQDACNVSPFYLLQDTLSIPGNFDGQVDNTVLLIDGQTFTAVLESDNEAAFVLQKVSTGPEKFEVLEAEQAVCDGSIHVIDIMSSIGNAKLRRGERTTINLQVIGMENTEDAVTILVSNLSPKHISLAEGEQQTWTIEPGDSPIKIIPVIGRRPGAFNVSIELQQSTDDIKAPTGETDTDIKEEEDGQEPPAEEQDSTKGAKPGPEDVPGGEDEDELEKEPGCGFVYGKVYNSIKAINHIVVFIEDECSLCPPVPPVDTLKFKNNCFRYEPSWGVVVEGGVIQVENDADIECDASIFTVGKWPDGSKGCDELLGSGETLTFEAKSYHESPTGQPHSWKLVDLFHKRADASFFVAPNPCFCIIGKDGSYSIGDLEPGTYTIRLYTDRIRTPAQSATVVIKPDEGVKKDFWLVKNGKIGKQ